MLSLSFCAWHTVFVCCFTVAFLLSMIVVWSTHPQQQSKLYEEQQLISRPRRPFIKEDIMQINLNVKNMVMHPQLAPSFAVCVIFRTNYKLNT